MLKLAEAPGRSNAVTKDVVYRDVVYR
ncbi:MAG: hypothetical protein RL136_2232, partial [Planctomycetota bacterium]